MQKTKQPHTDHQGQRRAGQKVPDRVKRGWWMVSTLQRRAGVYKNLRRQTRIRAQWENRVLVRERRGASEGPTPRGKGEAGRDPRKGVQGRWMDLHK